MAIGAVVASIPIAVLCAVYGLSGLGLDLWQGLSLYSLSGTSVLTSLMAAAALERENVDL